MGWKGTVRSIGAAVRASERDAKRRQRELEKRQKQYAKMQELEQAAYEVEAYENHIEIIQFNWKNIASSQEPKSPEKSKKHEKAAGTKAESYKPGFIDRLLKREEKKNKSLKENISRAIEQDEAEHEASVSDREKKMNDWKESVELAQLLLSGDNEAKIKAIKELDPFSEISNLGSRLSISVSDKGLPAFITSSINISPISKGLATIPSRLTEMPSGFSFLLLPGFTASKSYHSG